MKNFNISRCWQTFRWYLYENRRTLVRWFIGLALVTMVVESFFLSVSFDHLSDPGMRKMVLLALGANCTIFLFLVMFYGFSTIFGCLKRKERRISYLVLPASNLERYISALAYVLVVFPIAIILAFCLGDTLRALAFWLLGYGWISGVQVWAEMFLSRSWEGMLFGFSMWLFISSIYALGGVWFRKSAFPIVSAIMFFGTIALGYTLKSMRVSNVEVDASSTFVSICLILMALVIFYIGYLLFKRFQLITSKWTNL